MSVQEGRTDCLHEDTLLAMVDGELGPEERGRIKEHLGSCEACLQLYAAISSPSHGPPTPTASGAAAESATSGLLSRYHVTGPIGSGGMGIVYSGWDPELGRPVALKLLRFELSSRSDSRARVLREAQAMARLKHPNVVAIYDVGTWNERVFIAMELVEGGTLRKWMGAQERSWREIVDVYLDAGRGLASAHAAGLVHRDFKPDNVLVGRDGRVLVTDFGLARMREAEPTSEPAAASTPSPSPSQPPPPGEAHAVSEPSAIRPHTLSESQAVTVIPPGSIAPSPLTPRLALTPGTLTPIGGLVGTPAYMSPEQMAGGRADSRSDLFAFCTALYESLAGHRPYPGEDLATMRKRAESGVLEQPKRKLPRWLLRELSRGLRPDPSQRQASIDELLHAIEKKVRPNRARRVAVYALSALALIALLTGGFFAADRSGLLQKALRQTPSQRKVTAFVAQANEELRLHGRGAAAAFYENAQQPELGGDPRATLGYAQVLLGLTANTHANELLTKAWLRRDELLPAERTELEALRLQTQGKGIETLAARRASFESSPGDVSLGLLYAQQLGYLNKLKDELALLDQLHQLPKPAGSDPRIDLLEAEAANFAGDFPRALLAARRAAAGFQASGDRVPMAVARWRESWALQRQGSDPQLARRTLDQALALAREAKDESDVASMDLNLGQLEKAAGDDAGARAAFEEARAFFAKVGGQVNEASATQNIALLLWRQGDLAGALEQSTEARRTYLEVGNKRFAVSTQLAIGELRGELGDLPGASAAFTEAIASTRKAHDQPRLRDALLSLGDLRRQQGELAAAHQSLDEARTISEGANKLSAIDLLTLQNALDLDEKKFPEAEASAQKLSAMTAEVSHFDEQAQAQAQLAAALFAQGRLPAARAAVELGKKLEEKAGTPNARFALALIDGRLLAAEFPKQPARAKAVLDAAIAEGTSGVTAGGRLEVRLALARLLPQKEERGEALSHVAQEARAQGFLLLAKEADPAAAK